MAPLPTPGVTWTDAYEVLRELGRALDDAVRRASESVAVIAGMQAGDEIDEWLLSELLRLSGFDLDDAEDLEAAASAIAAYEGAGVLRVGWDLRSTLHETTGGFDREFASARASTYREGVTRRMRRLEEILSEPED